MSKRGSSSSEKEVVSSSKEDKGNKDDLSLSRMTSKGGPTSNGNSCFLVSVTGRIESAQIFGVDDVYCKFSLAIGNDWFITAVSYYCIAYVVFYLKLY